jgi:hypothetical protein
MTKEINLLELAPATRVRLFDGAVAEIVQNPADGIWLFCRYVTSPDAPNLVDGREHAVFAQDIESVLPAQDAP